MVKVIWIARFRRGVPRDAAREHWRDTHGVLAAEVPELDRYVQSHVAGPLPPATASPLFDGYSSGWYADEGAYARSMASPEWAAMDTADESLFDAAFLRGMTAFVDEHVLLAPRADAVKIAAVARFAAGGGERWAGAVEQALGDPPGLAGCVLNVAGDASGFGGVAEYWFDDHTALVNLLASPAWRTVQDSTAAAADAGPSWWALLEERVIKDVAQARPAAAGG